MAVQVVGDQHAAVRTQIGDQLGAAVLPDGILKHAGCVDDCFLISGGGQAGAQQQGAQDQQQFFHIVPLLYIFHIILP